MKSANSAVGVIVPRKNLPDELVKLVEQSKRLEEHARQRALYRESELGGRQKAKENEVKALTSF